MPYDYHYFESGEMSDDRLRLEIELLKFLQDHNLLENLSWNDYDTCALRIFHQIGIRQASKALFERHAKNTNEFKQYHFIKQCQNVIVSSKSMSKQILSMSFYLSILSFCSVIGFVLFEYVLNKNQITNLQQPLTTKKRHLSLIDNLSIILLTFATITIVCSIIILTRIMHRKLICLEFILLLTILSFLSMKIFQILTFLSIYRESRWLNIYDYTYS